MGFGSVMAIPDTYPIQKLIREYRIGGDGPMLPSQQPGIEKTRAFWTARLDALEELLQAEDAAAQQAGKKGKPK